MTGSEFAIGSRGSALALAQAKLVYEALLQQGHASRVVIIETEGDRRVPDTAWGEGAFVGAIERALQDGAVDLAVHSAKDVPTDQDPRLRIAAYLPRADPRDALVVRTDAKARRLADLPPGSRVGTDSPRRTGFLLARRPDLVVHPLHGNVDTRLRRLDAGETDALVLASAGLDRLGLGDRIAERLEPEIVPPASGQGAIAIQVRSDDERMIAVAAEIDDLPTRLAVEAERTFLSTSGGGCRAPIGALAELVDQELILLGGFARPDGSAIAVGRRRGPFREGDRLARELADELASQFRAGNPWAKSGETMAKRVIVTRASDQAAELMRELTDAGLEPVLVPAIAIELDPPGGALDRFARWLHTYRWVVITSANGARAILKAAVRVFTALETPGWAVIGPATRSVLEAEGIEVDFEPAVSSATALAAGLTIEPGDRVLVVRGDLADEDLAAALRSQRAEVDDVVAYRTREAPESSRAVLRAAADRPIAAALFTSASTVRGLVFLGMAEAIDVRSFPAVCIGPATADEARAAGFRILAVSRTPDSAALAATAATVLVGQPEETS